MTGAAELAVSGNRAEALRSLCTFLRLSPLELETALASGHALASLIVEARVADGRATYHGMVARRLVERRRLPLGLAAPLAPLQGR